MCKPTEEAKYISKGLSEILNLIGTYRCYLIYIYFCSEMKRD